MIRLAVIGTSGKVPQDAQRLDIKHMIWMADMVKTYITEVLKMDNSNVILVSGGSAWSDHVAVRLFLEGGFGGLELYLPARFNVKNKKYINSFYGRTLNQLHAKCQEKTGMDVFTDLARVNSKKDVRITLGTSFTARNTLIARNCDHMIAFTFREGDPTRGGTANTWSKMQGEKIHFNLELS